MYLQFEESKLCVKIEYYGNEDKTEIVNKFHNKLMNAAKLLDIELNRPQRLHRNAYSVTLGIVNLNYVFPSGLFIKNHLLSKLTELENLVNLTMK